MPGEPTITFELEIAPLLPKEPEGVPGQVIAPMLQGLLTPERLNAMHDRQIVPLGLRWRVTPGLGLSRGAFDVWRRERRSDDPIDINLDVSEVSNLGGGKFHIPSGPLYILVIEIRNTDPFVPVNVQALDTANNPLLLQAVQVPPSLQRTVRFQHPFLGGFSVRSGSPIILNVKGVTMEGYINQNDWQRIDVVGLPAKTGEVIGYDPGQQGDPALPQEPPEAAVTRLQIAQKFYQNLPMALPSGFNVPLWDIPDPKDAVNELRGGAPSLLQRLSQMFQAVDSGQVNSQAEFHTFEVIPGIQQPGTPGPVTEDATLDVALLASVLLNAVTDPWFALSSGFGTTDFPEFMNPLRFIEPETYFNVSHDYKVSAKFTFRMLGFEFSRELSALSHRSAFPTLAPTQLEASPFSLNRPPLRDDPWSAEISLSWNKINRVQIQGNAVAFREGGLFGNYLNPLRPASPTASPALFVPAKPGNTSAPGLETKNRFFHHGAQVPFEGTRTLQYGVASMDVFGRWSDWATTQTQVSAQLPEAPRLMALSLTPDKSRIVGNTVPHELSFEILWDWQDRSPKRFQVAAVFHARHILPDGTTDNGHIPPAVYPSIFQTNNTVAGGAFLELTFPSDIPPGTQPRFTDTPTPSLPNVTVELMPQATNASGQNVEGEMRRYRVKMRDVSVSFEPDEEWFFSLFVKAAEWRNPVRLSDETTPLPPNRPPRLTAFVPNPIPADPPVFVPATVLWATLPDARGISRFRLAFDRVPNATGGYAIYQAYETKLRELAGLPAVNGVDLVARATELRDVAMPLARCTDAFTRLNSKLLRQPGPGGRVEFEAELPGTLDGLVAFAVTSVTREQEASALSQPWLFVAIPRRAVPAMPALALAAGSNGTATLTCDFAKAPAPSHVEIFRARKEFAARDAGTMGLAVHESGPTAWQALDEQGRPTTGADIARFRFSFSDSTPASWFPYLYRAVAVGAGDDAIGLIPGRSIQSNLVSVERLPATMPVIEAAEGRQLGAQQITLQFRSDALIEPTPHGNFRVEITAYDFAQSQFASEPVLNVLLVQSEPRPAGALTLGILYRTDPDAAGLRTFSTLLDVVGNKFMFRVRLTDPLNRTSERIVSGGMQEIALPDLADLRLRRVVRDLLIRFTSAAPTNRPLFGAFRMEIFFISTSLVGGTRLLLRAVVHDIREGNLNTLQTLPVTTILRSSTAQPGQPPQYGAVIKRFFPPLVLPEIQGIIRVRLTAPDGTTTQIEQEIES